MSKHTPGPWVCTPTSHHAHDYRLEIPGGQMPFTRGEGVEYANAKLISAAPDLLDALEVLAGHVAHYAAMPHAHSEAYKDLANAHAAIRKATGATP